MTDFTPRAGRRDLDAVGQALGAWLCQRPGYAGALVHGLTRPAGAGLSNETYLFECQVGRHREALVMQVGPAAGGLFRDYDLGVMARVQQRLAATSSVPVAKVRWFEPDASVLGSPFYVVERVRGQVPSDNPSYHSGGWLAALPAAAQAEWLVFRHCGDGRPAPSRAAGRWFRIFDHGAVGHGARCRPPACAVSNNGVISCTGARAGPCR